MNKDLATIIRAKNAGIVCLVIFILSIFVSIIAGTGKNIAFDLINLGIYAGVSISYVVMLLGLKPISQEKNDQQLLNAVNQFIWVCIVFYVVSAPMLMQSFLPSEVLKIFALLCLVIYAVTGVFSIRLGNNLKRLEVDYGRIAKNASLWSRVSGWLAVSFILLPLGLILSCVADYFMWRLLKERVSLG